MSFTLAAALLSTAAPGAVSIDKGTVMTRDASYPASLSGITYAGGDTFYMIADAAAESGIYTAIIKLSKDGKSILSLEMPAAGKGVKLPGADDLEACAFDPATGNVWASSETRKTVKEYDPVTGNVISTLEIPPVFKKHIDLENNFGIEGLTISPDGRTLWLCNEEALRVDGKRSSGKDGTTVRLVKYTRKNPKGTFTPVAMYAYKTDKWAYTNSVSGRARGGVTALCALDDGSLLVLERQISFATDRALTSALRNSLGWKIYRVADFASATNVIKYHGLNETAYDPVTKTLLAEHDTLLTSTGNFEGLSLGPRLADGSRSLIIVSDAGDGYSKKHIRPLVLLHPPAPNPPVRQ